MCVRSACGHWRRAGAGAPDLHPEVRRSAAGLGWAVAALNNFSGSVASIDDAENLLPFPTSSLQRRLAGLGWESWFWWCRILLIHRLKFKCCVDGFGFCFTVWLPRVRGLSKNYCISCARFWGCVCWPSEAESCENQPRRAE